MLLVCGLSVSLSFASPSKEIRSAYYAEKMGETFGLDETQQALIYTGHMKKLSDWEAIAPIKETPGGKIRVNTWAAEFKSDMLDIVGRENEKAWKDYNKLLQQEMTAEKVEDSVTEQLLEKYAKGTPPVQIIVREFKRPEGANKTMHNRSAHVAQAAAVEFGLTPEQQQEVYDLQMLFIQCWNEINTLRETEPSESLESLKEEINTTYRKGLLAIVGAEQEQKAKAFKTRMFHELKEIR
jgi:hypothetical protein